MNEMKISVAVTKPIAVPGYTREATVIGLGDHPSYFYGHSTSEVLVKILAHMLKEKP